MKHIHRLAFRVLGIFLVLFPLGGFSQLTEDFSDRNISTNPTWIGDDTLFSVTANEELQSQGNALTETIYLSTPQSLLDDTEWRIDLSYAFAPSTSNYIRVYLIADQANLKGPLNGYFIQIGESGSNDSYDLYRQDGTTVSKIIDGIDGRAGNGVDARVRVLRSASGNWELYTDQTKIDNFTLEGSTSDNTYTSTSFFGLSLKHTSSRAHSFFFDNIYVGPEILDTTPPSLISLNPASAKNLLLTFSEDLDNLSAETPTNYQLLPGNINPVSALQNTANLSEISLSFSTPLINGNTYDLIVANQKDLIGNQMAAPETLDFVFFIPEIPASNDVVINEIFADPTPSQGLPEAEFVELLNRSNKVFDLENWQLSNGSRIGKLPAHILRPGDIVILTRDSDVSKFAPLGTTLGLDNWTSLVNSGDNLGLRSAGGTLMDSVDYQPAWFKDAFKEGGGFSLERINPENLHCPPIANWAATVNSLGGTPGLVNSIFDPNPENDPPSLFSVSIIDNQTLRLCFDEAMEEAGMEEITSYDLSGIGTPISATAEGPDFACVKLSFPSTLTLGQVYQLIVDGGLEDCSGNPIGASASISVVLARPAESFEVVITELFPDYSPSQGLPEAEFVEIYNRSNEVLDLSGAVLSDGGGFAQINDLQIFSGEYVILCKREEQIQFETYGKALGIEGFPSLGNSTDSLTLFAASGAVLDYVYYADDWYQNADKADGGYSLERIDPDYVDCNHADNWTASHDLNGATPGEVNSTDGDFQDTKVPMISGIRIVGSNGLELFFSEQMDPVSLETIDFYTLDQGIGSPLLAMAKAPHFRSVRISFDSDFQQNALYTLNINGLKDCAGNAMQLEYVFGLPLPAEEGDILLNEILFNPRSGGSDYLEIVNVSDKVIDLASIRIGEIYPDTDSIFNSDILTNSSFLFLPGQIICLSQDVGAQILQYQPISAANFLEMASFPSYDDASGECVVFSDSGIVLDRFYYEDDFHYSTLIEDEGVSLERISLNRSFTDPANWHSAASTARFGTPGYANSQAIDGRNTNSELRLDREVFSPDLDGVGDVVAIQYNFDFAGGTARVSVLDRQGRLIKIIQQNALLGAGEGSFFWDGSDAKGGKANIGIYIIVVEVYRPDLGNKDVYKLPIVLSARF